MHSMEMLALFQSFMDITFNTHLPMGIMQNPLSKWQMSSHLQRGLCTHGKSFLTLQPSFKMLMTASLQHLAHSQISHDGMFMVYSPQAKFFSDVMVMSSE